MATATKKFLEQHADEDAFYKFIGELFVERLPNQRDSIDTTLARRAFEAGWRMSAESLGIKPKRKLGVRAPSVGSKKEWPTCKKCGNKVNTKAHRVACPKVLAMETPAIPAISAATSIDGSSHNRSMA